MPRQPRLDAPGVLHHVMVRGIERRAIFRDDTDRADFVGRRGGREAYAGDERILGSSTFVEALRRHLSLPTVGRRAALSVETIAQRVCTRLGMDPARQQRGGRKQPVSRARVGIAYLGVEVVGHSGRALAPRLGIRPVSVYAAARRGLAERRRWDVLLTRH